MFLNSVLQLSAGLSDVYTSIAQNESRQLLILKVTTIYFIVVTLFFADNYLTEYRITMEFLHNFLKTMT